jgi:hypothetical protein
MATFSTIETRKKEKVGPIEGRKMEAENKAGREKLI